MESLRYSLIIFTAKLVRQFKILTQQKITFLTYNPSQEYLLKINTYQKFLKH